MIFEGQWESYLCRVNDKPASILLNLALSRVATIDTKPWLLWVWVYFNEPRPDGLSSSNEAPMLYQIEDRLVATVNEHCHALWAGRITTDGRREFYFYAEDNRSFTDAVAESLSAFPAYKYDQDSQLDKDWNQYKFVLFPSEEQLQKIGNRSVLEQLEKNGDDHAIPREVDHLVFFEEENARELFSRECNKLGYSCTRESNDDERLGVRVTKTHPVTPETIDRVVLELFALAKRFGGTYDGWGTEACVRRS